MADQVLICGDTIRTPEMRHEVPVAIPDPFLYAEVNGTRHIVIGSMEMPRLREVGRFELHPPEEFGIDELIREGRGQDEIRDELFIRACRGIGLENAVVPFAFPLHIADLLRRNGIDVRVDKDLFDDRRRVKSEAEIAGIRRAQRAAEAGMQAARGLLRRAQPNGESVLLDGEPLFVERVKAAVEQAFIENGCAADEFIVSHGPQSAIGHEMGSGPIAPNEPIVIDLWPRDRESGCYADMTRTYVVAEPPAEIVEWHGLCKQALDRAIAETKPGIKGRQLFDGSCDIFEQAGYPTQRTKQLGQTLDEGFFHSLGHGVGLEVHEQPGLGMVGEKELVAGDVITIEPGLYRQGFGGCRLEDLVLVTDDGAENLTQFPYDLEP